jgi:hypothetical protein
VIIVALRGSMRYSAIHMRQDPDEALQIASRPID